MAEEKTEGLEGLDDFGDDFGDQLDAFMEGENEEEGDSELDSFFEDLSTIDDLEMKDEGEEVMSGQGSGGGTEADSNGDVDSKPVEEVGEPATAAAAAAAATPAESMKEKKPEKEKKEKGTRKPILFAALIASLVGIILGTITVAILFYLNMPEGLPKELAEEKPKIAPPAIMKIPEPEPEPEPEPKPKIKSKAESSGKKKALAKSDSNKKSKRYYVQVANCVFEDCIEENINLLNTHGYKSRVIKVTETSSMAEVVTSLVLGDEESVRLVNHINETNLEAGKAYRAKGKLGFRISMGLFPNLEVAGRVRNYLNQEFGEKNFFEIKKATENIAYHRVYAGGYRNKKQAETLRKLLGRKENNFKSAFIVLIKR